MNLTDLFLKIIMSDKIEFDWFIFEFDIFEIIMSDKIEIDLIKLKLTDLFLKIIMFDKIHSPLNFIFLIN